MPGSVQAYSPTKGSGEATFFATTANGPAAVHPRHTKKRKHLELPARKGF